MSRRKSARPPSNDPVGDAAFEAAMLERWPRPEPVSLGLRVASLAFVFGLTWYAIHYRGATAGALLLPMAGEIVAGMLIGLVLAATVVRDEKFRKEAFGALRFWAIVAVVFLAWSWFRADRAQLGLDRQLLLHVGTIVDYVRMQGMFWPMLAAGIGLVAATAGDVAAYRRKGPPFVYLGSLSLGLRLFVLIFAAFGFIVAIDWTRRQRAELMWCVLLVGEVFALWAPYAVQKKIREEHAKRVGKEKSN